MGTTLPSLIGKYWMTILLQLAIIEINRSITFFVETKAINSQLLPTLLASKLASIYPVRTIATSQMMITHWKR
jgi:hypothetical protein